MPNFYSGQTDYIEKLNELAIPNATHTGDATGNYALTVVKINGTSLSGLATGILKNTTGTGIPSIAVNSDLPAMSATVGGAVPTPPNNTTSFLRGDGTFATPQGTGLGDMVLGNAQTNTALKTFLNATFGLRNVANTITNFFTTAATVARTWVLPDKDGTIAMTSDITGINSNTNTGDQTSIVGITGTIAQFNTAVTDANLATLNNNTFTGSQIGTVTELTSSAGQLAINLATNNNFSYTTSENTTLSAPSNPVAGQSGVINITQGTVPRTLDYNTFWKFPAGVVPTLTTIAGASDLFAYNVKSATHATAQLIKDIR